MIHKNCINTQFKEQEKVVWLNTVCYFGLNLEIITQGNPMETFIFVELAEFYSLAAR